MGYMQCQVVLFYWFCPKLELSAQYHLYALHFLMPFPSFHTIIAPTSALSMLLLYTSQDMWDMLNSK